MITEKQRELYPDVIKGIAIILVVVGHCIQYGSGGGYYSNETYFDNVVFKVIYSFHMPLFMLVSGYFFGHTLMKNNNNDINIKWNEVIKIIVRKIQQLLIPILVWALLLFIFRVASYISSGTISAGIVIDYFKIAIGNFWFLWSVLINSVIVVVVMYVTVKSVCSSWLRYLIYVLILALMIVVPDSFPSIEQYKFMYPFFVLGSEWYVHKNLRAKAMEKIRTNIWLLLVVSLIIYGILLIFYDKSSYVYTTGISILGDNGLYQIVIDIYRWVIGLIGSSVILFAVYAVIRPDLKDVKSIIWKAVAKLGINSMGIYIISSILNTYVLLKVADTLSFNVLLILLETVIMFAICLILVWILKKFRVTRVLLLGGR